MPASASESPGPLSTRTAIEAELLRLFEAAPVHSYRQLTPLHVASTNFAHSLRNEGLSPEQVVIALKHLLCHGGSAFPYLWDQHDTPAAPGDRNEASGGPTKYARVLKWCIEAYFDDAP